jgi:hypothetical protein
VQIYLDADNSHVWIDGDGTTNQITMNGTSDQLDLLQSNQSVTASHTGVITFYNGSNSNSLTLGGNFTSANVTFGLASNGHDLTIGDGLGDQITLQGDFAGSTAGLASVHFANGTVLTSDQIVALIGTQPH